MVEVTVNWSKWGWCPTCERTAGAPCKDMRYAKSTGEFNRDKPHDDREREMVDVPIDYDSEVVDALTELTLVLDKVDRLLVQSVKQHEGDSDDGLEWIAQLALEIQEKRKRLHDIEDSLCAKIPRLAKGAWEFTVGRVGIKVRGGTKYVRWDRSRLIPVVARTAYSENLPKPWGRYDGASYDAGVDAGVAALAKVIPQGGSMQFGTNALRKMGIDPIQYATTEPGRKNVTLTRLTEED